MNDKFRPVVVAMTLCLGVIGIFSNAVLVYTHFVQRRGAAALEQIRLDPQWPLKYKEQAEENVRRFNDLFGPVEGWIPTTMFMLAIFGIVLHLAYLIGGTRVFQKSTNSFRFVRLCALFGIGLTVLRTALFVLVIGSEKPFVIIVLALFAIGFDGALIALAADTNEANLQAT